MKGISMVADSNSTKNHTIPKVSEVDLETINIFPKESGVVGHKIDSDSSSGKVETMSFSSIFEKKDGLTIFALYMRVS